MIHLQALAETQLWPAFDGAIAIIAGAVTTLDEKDMPVIGCDPRPLRHVLQLGLIAVK